MSEMIQEKVKQEIESHHVKQFIPTGALEPAIIAVGNSEHTIVNLQCANKLGKTATAAAIFCNIFWDHDFSYFDYPTFQEWPFKDDDGNPIKRARIIGTPNNVAEGGPIEVEIDKWWPAGRYTRKKRGKTYNNYYETDTNWILDVMTFEQKPKEFEGPLISLQWIDEPARGELMGPTMSRFSKGGILLLSQTPIDAGPMMDVIDDLQERGTTVVTVTATIFDNSITDGIPNSKGTKRGLMTNEEIETWVAGIPLDERESRVYGRNIGKSGKIYPMYNDDTHVRHHDLSSPIVKNWNGYCIMDPHDRFYPFIQWWAVTPPDPMGEVRYVLYNEWPTIATLKGFYDEKRHTVDCNKTPEDISEFIKILDGREYGINIIERGIDPRFAKNSESDFSKKTDGIVMEYALHGINFTMPSETVMQSQRDRIRKLLEYDTSIPLSVYNEPKIQILPHCRNSRRAFMRHYWFEGGKSKEAEPFKDPMDCARMFFALENHRGYQNVSKNKKKNSSSIIIDNLEEEFAKGLSDIGLG